MPNGGPTIPALAQDKSIAPNNNYMERLQKIIPIEITGLYFFLSKLATEDYEGFFGICIVVVILLMYFLYLPRVQNVLSANQRLIIVISFVVWAANIDVELLKRIPK